MNQETLNWRDQPHLAPAMRKQADGDDLLVEENQSLIEFAQRFMMGCHHAATNNLTGEAAWRYLVLEVVGMGADVKVEERKNEETQQVSEFATFTLGRFVLECEIKPYGPDVSMEMTGPAVKL